jgi:hypothetical protein
MKKQKKAASLWDSGFCVCDEKSLLFAPSLTPLGSVCSPQCPSGEDH